MSGPTRLLWLPHTLNPAYAGPRLRCLLPAAALRRQGLQVDITDQLPPPRGRAQVCHDVAVVQAKWLLDADDESFAQRADALQALKAAGSVLVIDSFDNYFLNEGADPQRHRRLESYRQVLRLADRFTVSSPGLVPLLERELPQPRPVQVVGDPVELPGDHAHYEGLLRRLSPTRWQAWLQAQRAVQAVRGARGGCLQLLWFGNQGSGYARGGMSELEPLLPILAECHRRRPLELHVVSNSRPRYEQVLAQARFPHRYSEWSRLHFTRLLAAHDLVLLPNRTSDFTVAKSNNRLLLALAQGVPVMADALPDYLPWQRHFASRPWSELEQVLGELEVWRDRARAARSRLLRTHGLPAVTQAWRAVLLGDTTAHVAHAARADSRRDWAGALRRQAPEGFATSLGDWQPTR